MQTANATPADLDSQLDERSRDIFRRIVESYLAEGEPVGSRNLSKMLPTSLSPASVRTVMSDLETLGLIYAPHVSAGRMPTEQGLRFFVDAFMDTGAVSDEERSLIETRLGAEGGHHRRRAAGHAHADHVVLESHHGVVGRHAQVPRVADGDVSAPFMPHWPRIWARVFGRGGGRIV